MKQKNKLLHVRTAKTASSNIQNWCELNKIVSTDNMTWLSNYKNQLKLNNPEFNILFTSVRNPYRRAYSQYRYLKNDANWRKRCDPKSFKDFLKFDFTELSHEHLQTHNTPVAYYLDKYLNKITHFIKVEKLYEDLQIICDLYNLILPQKQAIVYETHYHKPEMDKEFENKEIRDLCYEKYKDDFLTFNYSYDDWTDLYPEQSFLRKKKDESKI